MARMRRSKDASRTVGVPGSGKEAEPQAESRKTESSEDDGDEEENGEDEDEDATASAVAEGLARAPKARGSPKKGSNAGDLVQPTDMTADMSLSALGEAGHRGSADE